MFDNKTEFFLNEYFLCEAVVGKYCDTERLFNVIGEAFGISEKSRGELFAAANVRAVKNVTSEAEYKRYKRALQFAEMSNVSLDFTEDEKSFIEVKGNAIKTAAKQELVGGGDFTAVQVRSGLTERASEGNVVALRLLGLFYCEGVFFDADIEVGKANLTKASRWGDVVATLYLLRYTEGDKTPVMRMLNAAVKDTAYSELSGVARKAYGLDVFECDKEVLLLKRAFSVSKIKKDAYHPVYARLIYGKAIGLKDKERVIFDENKETLSETCDLPLRLSVQSVTVNENAFDVIPFERKSENKLVLDLLSVEGFTDAEEQRAAVIYSSDSDVLDYYVKAAYKIFVGANVETFDASDLGLADVDRTKNNAVVRALRENSANVVLFIIKGETEGYALDFIKSFLSAAKRRKFRLNLPAVTLDLSSVIPVCVCDKENALKLREHAESVELSVMTESEKAQVLREAIRKKLGANVSEITPENEAIKTLCKLPLKKAKGIIDKFARENRGNAVSFTAEALKPYLSQVGHTGGRIGFGGVNDERR